MAKYIKKKDLKRAIEVCTWYHIGRNGELVKGAGVNDEPLYKYSDIKEIIKDLPTRKINGEENEPYIDIETGILHWHGWKYRRIGDCRSTADTPQTESHITCYGTCTDKCGAYENGDCTLNAKIADTPQTERRE